MMGIAALVAFSKSSLFLLAGNLMTRVFARLSATEEWKKDVESNLWENTFLNSEESRKFFRAEYDMLKAVLTELGVVKQP
jgi:tripartite-type tricarboxylate transporter receptor subunit TctC